MKGVRRRLSVAPRTQKDALSDADLITIMRLVGDDLAGRRDRVLLTWGFVKSYAGAAARGRALTRFIVRVWRGPALCSAPPRHPAADASRGSEGQNGAAAGVIRVERG